MSDEKIALITGITGQDGSYLAELLLGKGYTVSRLSVFIVFASFAGISSTCELEWATSLLPLQSEMTATNGIVKL